MTGWIIGVDVGGTFTDFAASNAETGQRHIHKRPSTPDDPSRAIIEGLAELLEKAGIRGDQVERLAHGTTVATNALLQRKGAQVGLVTTRGFRDLVEIGRQVRPRIYDLQEDAPPPLVRRDFRFEIRERIGPGGETVEPLSDADIQDLVDRLKANETIRSVAVCLLFSFINPEHEARIAARIRDELPHLFVSTSSGVQPEFREYERFSTTLINAFLQPEVSRYMERLRAAIGRIAPRAKLGIFQSSGGLMQVERAAEFPVRTALSGPAAGAVGAAAAGTRSGIGNLITLDMGGTSTDVCLIRGGRTARVNVREIAGFRIRLPMVDIHTVGAGGGSIARIAPDGLMKVGPESAGAVPGPACYGQGGTEPTVSDANVVLGRLPTSLAGGGLTLDRGRAQDAVARIAEALGISTIRAALGIVGIVNSNMTRAIRAVSTEKGHDPRDFTLMPFGGAGGLHAVEVAASLGIRRIVVPPAPGILCAEGLIEAELQEDFVITCRAPLDAAGAGLREALAEISRRADAWLADDAADGANPRKIVTLDMRYIGQNYELPVTVGETADTPVLPDVDDLKERFFEEHLRSYGHVDREAPVEIMNVRLKAVADLTRADEVQAAAAGPAGPVSHHDVWFSEDAPVATAVYRRSSLAAGSVLHGPAIITQLDATTVVPPNTRVTVDAAMSMILEPDDA